MNQADVVRHYLHESRDVDFRDTGFPFITISRQAGTEAHAIGRYILMRLAESDNPDLNRGWDLFDQKLCALIAMDKSLEVDYDTLVNDQDRTDGIQRMIYEMLIGKSQQYKIQKKIGEVIRLLARLGKVVVIGRAGFLITRDMPGGIHVRIIASMKYRVKNIMKQYGLSERTAAKKLHEIDEERALFLKNHHNFDIADLSRFDIIWNMDRLRIPEMVNTMAEMIRLRLQHLREIGAIHEP